MRAVVVILLCLWILPSITGQERKEVELLNETVWVKMLRKSNQIHVKFEEGDSAVFDIKVAKSKKIRKYCIYDSNDKLLRTFRKPSRLLGESFDIKEDGGYYVVFRNGGLFSRQVDLVVKRYPEPPRDTAFWETLPQEEESLELGQHDRVSLDTLSSDSTIIVMKKITRVTYDTIPEELLETSLMLDAKLNLDGQSKGKVDIVTPSKEPNTRYYWAGWIGVGDDALAEYERLKSEPPSIWQEAGVDNPLVAYGKGLTYSLPSGNQGGEISVHYIPRRGGRGILKQGGFIREGVWPSALYLENKERVSSVNIHVKIMGFRITKTEEEEEVPVTKIVKRTKKIEKK